MHVNLAGENITFVSSLMRKSQDMHINISESYKVTLIHVKGSVTRGPDV